MNNKMKKSMFGFGLLILITFALIFVMGSSVLAADQLEKAVDLMIDESAHTFNNAAFDQSNSFIR